MSPDISQDLRNIASAQTKGKRIVFTNGCFDILHVGHFRYLQEARALGDLLVVGVNSDSSVSRLKGPDRPIVPEDDRCELLLGLKPVDFVLLFSEDTPYALIQRVQPDVLVKGGDWKPEEIVGADIVIARGGTVQSLSFIAGHSTTDIVEKIRQRQ